MKELTANWIKEKARKERRAEKLTAEMEAAIANLDKERFLAAHEAAANCMRKRLRDEYYLKFLKAKKANRGA